MFRQLLSITRNTFIESIRQPVFVVLLLAGILILVLSPALAAYTLDNDNKMLVDMCLSMIFVLCLLIAAFTATGVLSSEIENKTVLTVVSKPVARPVFVVGKYLGVAGAIAVAFFILSLVFLFTRRHGVMQTASDHFDGPILLFGSLALLGALGVATVGNYMYRWVFSSTFVTTLTVTITVAALLAFSLNKGWAIQSPLHDFSEHGAGMGQIVIGLLLIFEAVLMLTAVAIAASTRLGQIMTLVVCLGVFVIGLISNSFSQLVDHRLNLPNGIGVVQSLGAVLTADTALHLKLFYTLAKLLYVALPNLQFLWPADALADDNPFSGIHVATVTAYAALYTTVVLCLAVVLFQRREVG